MGVLGILLIPLIGEVGETNYPGGSDSIAVVEFEAKDVSPEVTHSITNEIRNRLGEQLPVFSTEELDKKGFSGVRSLVRVEEIGVSQTVPILISGEVKARNNIYRIKVVYLDFYKNKKDTIIAVTTSPSTLIPDVVNSLVNLIKGEGEKEFGSISVESQPSGADILLDGEFVGTTPEKIDLIPFGEHFVLLSKKGYATGVKLIVVYPGKTAHISLTLTPVSGSLIAPPEEVPVYLVDEIVVRGERIREELFKVSKGVDVLSMRDIEYSGAKNIPELLSQVVGVSVIDKTGSGVSSSVAIRGMDPTKYTLVTLDGIVINRADGEVNWGAIPLEIVKRIEVIRGGAAAPYGGEIGAAGGVINIVTRERERNKVSLSSTNGKDGGVAITLSESNSWDLWINTHGRKGNGWREEEKYDIRTFYGKFTLPIVEKSSLVLSLDAARQKTLFPGGLTDVELKRNPEQSGGDKEDKLWENIRLTSQYQDGGPDSRFLFRFHTMPQNYKSTGLNKWELKGIEIGTSSEYGRKNFTFLFEAQTTNLSRKVYGLSPETLICHDNSQSIVFRPLLEWEEKIFRIFSLTPGIKYEWVGYRIQDNTNPLAPTKSISVANLSPKFGIMWASTAREIFFSIERTAHVPKSYEKVKNVELKPEMLTSAEFGARARWYPFFGSFSIFYVDIEDQILMEGVTFRNSREPAFHRGAEGDLNYRINENLSLFLNHTYIEAKFKDTDRWIPQVPQTEGGVGVRITYMPTYSLTFIYNWYGKSYVDRENTPGWVVDPYQTLALHFKYKPHPSFGFGLSFTNLTDQGGKTFGYRFQNEARYYPIVPRGFRVEGSFEF